MDTTVAKALSLLEELAGSDTPLGVTELAQRLGLGKSNVHRLLQTLVELNYAKKAEGPNYVATLRMWEFGCSIVSHLALRDVARPFMRQLSDLTKETVHLSEYQRGEVLYLEKIESKEPVRAYTQLGGRAPANCTATGKILMAYLERQEIEEILSDVTQYSPTTITDLEKFLTETSSSRARRYALNNGEWRADINGLASPVADATGTVIAAIGISAPASRLTSSEIEKYAPSVIETSRAISQQLGCSRNDWEQLAEGNPIPEG